MDNKIADVYIIRLPCLIDNLFYSNTTKYAQKTRTNYINLKITPLIYLNKLALRARLGLGPS